MRKERYNFRKLKRLIDSQDDTKELIDMFYFNKKAIGFADSLKKDFMMNPYYNLTTLDLLLMVEEADKIDDVLKNLLKDYDEDYAFSMWQNFLYDMGWEV